MRRAALLVAAAALTLVSSGAHAATAAKPITQMTGIGLVDYASRPTFKVGDWVKYEVTSLNSEGKVDDDYMMTLLIAGQEFWWGEKCFYLEVLAEAGTTTRSVTATLMSYAIFDDSLASDRFELYQRKSVLGFDNLTGEMEEVLVRPKQASLSARSPLTLPRTSHTDTLGRDTVVSAKGVLGSTKYVLKQSYGTTGGTGDSTLYRELTEIRTDWRSPDVPITHLARETNESTQTRQAWLVGRSREGQPVAILGAGTVIARAVDWGHGGESKMLPPDRRHSFAELEAIAKMPARLRPKPPKPIDPKKVP